MSESRQKNWDDLLTGVKQLKIPAATEDTLAHGYQCWQYPATKCCAPTAG